jgi:hypothetical protein
VALFGLRPESGVDDGPTGLFAACLRSRLMTPEEIRKMSPQECGRWLLACAGKRDAITARNTSGIWHLLKVDPALKLRPVSISLTTFSVAGSSS